MKLTSTRLAVLSTLLAVQAHSEPKTAEEIASYQALQAQAYHCAPAVAAYEAQRKRSWAHKMLGADALADKNLFLEGAFDDNKKSTGPLLSCEQVVETKIKNNTCVLAPEVTQGPYYHTEGHPIRQNMAEWQLGVLFLMDIGIIDVETCEPYEGVLIDAWHANATGYYAGHPSPAPHLVGEEPQRGGPRSGLLSAYPRTNDDETWLRGAWPSDKNGVVQFTSIFPGFYTGRATHIHIRAHTEWTTNANNTFNTKNMIYTGQVFVPDDVNIEIDKVYPYNTNPLFHDRTKHGRTRNWRDSLGIFPDSHRNGHNPTMEIQKLNGVLEQGLIGYITLGLNKTAGRLDTPWHPY